MLYSWQMLADMYALKFFGDGVVDVSTIGNGANIGYELIFGKDKTNIHKNCEELRKYPKNIICSEIKSE